LPEALASVARHRRQLLAASDGSGSALQRQSGCSTGSGGGGGYDTASAASASDPPDSGNVSDMQCACAAITCCGASSGSSSGGGDGGHDCCSAFLSAGLSSLPRRRPSQSPAASVDGSVPPSRDDCRCTLPHYAVVNAAATRRPTDEHYTTWPVVWSPTAAAGNSCVCAGVANANHRCPSDWSRNPAGLSRDVMPWNVGSSSSNATSAWSNNVIQSHTV
jgi:hypothetical protein